MKHVLILCLALAASAGTAVADSRNSTLKPLDKDYEAKGWEAVGRLDLNGGYCTATLIAPSLILSAAHCVYDDAGHQRKSEDLTFRAGYRHGKTAATRTIRKIAAHPGYNPNEPLTNKNVEHDLALLELSSPILSHEVNPFALHGERVEPGPVSVVSYGKGRSQQQSRQKECGLEFRQGDMLVFDCNVTFGSSGAPVFSHLNGRGRILSVISGGSKNRRGEKIAMGPHLPPLVDDLKRQLRSQSTGSLAKIKRIGVGQNGSTGAKFLKVN